MNNGIYKKIIDAIDAKSIVWLVTVVGVGGSTPGKIGMKMLVSSSGELDGTIGGGAIELLVTKKILKEKPTTTVRWSFDLGAGSHNEKTGMLCGGEQEVLVDPLFSGHELYIIGAGHCGQALSLLAAKCDFLVHVIDDRKEFVTSELHPSANKLICTQYNNIEEHIKFSPEIYIVVMTHGHKHDELVMRKLIRKPHKYLGIIGSKNKVSSVFTKMLTDGFDKEELRKLYTPIGLNLGSQTPNEIAVSIMAQLLAVKNNINNLQLNNNPIGRA